MLDVIDDRKAGRLSPEEADVLLDAAVPSAVRLQERAGLTYVSDGEWRRESYIKVFSEHVDGFGETGREAIVPGAVPDPCVVAEIRERAPIAATAAAFLRSVTSHRTIVTLPSPFILGWRLWDPVASRSAYATRDEFMDACVPVLPPSSSGCARWASTTSRSTSRGCSCSAIPRTGSDTASTTSSGRSSAASRW